MRLLYRFSGPVTNKVIHSQVVGTLTALQRAGIPVDLAGWSGLGHALTHRAAYQEAEAALHRQLPARFHRTIDRLPGLDRFLKRRELEQAIARAEGERVVLQTRSHDLAFLMADLRQTRPELRFVYEVRGDFRAETESQRGPGPHPELGRFEEAMGRALRHADLVLCVSQVLAERMIRRHDLEAGRLFVMPCTADEERFRPDAELRRQRRDELGLGEDDLLLVYSGSLVKGWDVPERIRKFLLAQLPARAGLHVLLLSPDVEQAAALAAQLPAGRVHCRSVDHWSMQSWLCAGDAGLLLRAAHPLNEAASPTKAAELLLCGLPLLISPGVGDYSAWVAGNGLGLLIDPDLRRGVDWLALRALDPREIRRQALERVARSTHVRRLAERLRAL